MKSLNFTGRSLDEELGKYYKSNDGFVNYEELLEMLSGMGVKGKEHWQMVEDFMEVLSQKVHRGALDKTRLIRRGDLLSHIKQNIVGYV